MGVTGTLRKETVERRQVVVDLIKESKNSVKAKDLADALNMSPASFKVFMHKLMYDDTRVRSFKRGTHIEYYFEDTEEKNSEPEPETEKTDEEIRFEDTHNAEGYSDPTMSAAMRNVGETGREITAGEIWQLKNDDRYIGQKVVILAKFNNTITCLLLYDNPGTLQEYEKAQCKTVTIDGKMHMVNVIKILTKGVKCLAKKAGKTDLFTLRMIRGYVGEYLGMQGVGVMEVKVPVAEKKETEVAPVKAVKPVCEPKKDTELQDLRHELEIMKAKLEVYEHVVEAFAAARR